MEMIHIDTVSLCGVA